MAKLLKKFCFSKIFVIFLSSYIRLKRNLLLAVNKKKTIYFKITEKLPHQLNSKNYFFQIISCLNDEEISKTIFIMDNYFSGMNKIERINLINKIFGILLIAIGLITISVILISLVIN